MSDIADPNSVYDKDGRLRPPPAVVGSKFIRMWILFGVGSIFLVIGTLNLPPKGSNDYSGNMLVAVLGTGLAIIIIYLAFTSFRWDYHGIGFQKAEWKLEDYLKDNNLKAKVSSITWSRHPDPDHDFKFDGVTQEYPIVVLDVFVNGGKFTIYPYWVIDDKTKETSLLVESYLDGTYSYTNILAFVDRG